MATPLEFTGERFLPGTEGEIAHEHWHRYAFARGLVAGRRVLDIACGEGYGSALLAGTAKDVVGVDIDADAIAHARAAYATRDNLRFVEGSAAAIPLPDASVDAVVSFETVEHLAADDQTRMIAEFARVLAPRGLLVLSSPNRPEYSEARNYANPFHLHELDRDELATLLGARFPARRWYRQHRILGSALWGEGKGGSYEHWSGDGATLGEGETPEAMYFVVVAAAEDATLGLALPALSLFSDRDEREWRRIENLANDRGAALDRQTAHVHHLEALVAERERIIVERDRQVQDFDAARLAREREHRREIEELRNAHAAMAAQQANEVADLREQLTAGHEERRRLERAIGAQERIIAYRQSARWWFKLPWLRVKLLWKRWRRE